MLESDLGFLVKGDLLPREQIAAFCKEAGYQCRGIPLHKEPDGPILAWVKYGPTVTRAEALTQDWVAKALDADPEAPVRVPRVHDFFTIRTLYSTIGHIVMEHVATPNCAESDVELVAKAVEWLIRVPAPTSVPGPVGGGPVVHPFFYDWASYITYHTVDELQDHVNGVSANFPVCPDYSRPW